jgi:hypothetical protein
MRINGTERAGNELCQSGFIQHEEGHEAFNAPFLELN